MRYSVYVDVLGEEEPLRRKVDLVIDGIPFPGVGIGSLTVKAVALAQGLDSIHTIECVEVDQATAAILRKQGWS